MTGAREADLQQAADLLLDARRTGHRLADLPGPFCPTTQEEIDRIADLVAAGFGDVGGYKIGAPSPTADPTFAPMPAAWVAPSGTTLSAAWHYRIVEAEIAFIVGEDLPPRATPYTRDEVLSAMASCHPVIEVLETAFADPAGAHPKAVLADLQRNGAFIYGPPFAEWRTTDFTRERVVLTVDGTVREDRTGSNTSGDFFRLLVWMANQASARTGGLRAGQWITTGSWTGNTLASSGSSVDATFSNAGYVNVRFG